MPFAVDGDTHSHRPHDDTDGTLMLPSVNRDRCRRDHSLLDISIIAASKPCRRAPTLPFKSGATSAINLNVDVKLNRTFLL